MLIFSMLPGIYIIKQSIETERKFQKLVEEELEGIYLLAHARNALWELRQALPEYLMESKNHRLKIKEDYGSYLNDLETGIDSFKKRKDDDHDKKLVEYLQENLDFYFKYREHFFKLVDQGDVKKAREYRMQFTKIPAQNAAEAISNLMEHQIEEARTQKNMLSIQVKKNREIVTYYLILEFLLCCLMFYALALSNKKMEISRMQMAQSAKLASLGEMSAGVAHEINNPLTIIHGKTSQLLRRASAQNIDAVNLQESLEKIMETTTRIAKIIKGMRSISRDASNDPFETIELKKLGGHIFALCSERFRINEVKFEMGLIPDVALECRATQIEQLILNLLNNSYDAIATMPEKWIHLDFIVANNRVKIIVTDSGDGIDPRIIEKLMQPFFTTKEVGKGTGLGLSVSRAIADEHQGMLFYDQTSLNTSFVFELPLKRVLKLHG